MKFRSFSLIQDIVTEDTITDLLNKKTRTIRDYRIKPLKFFAGIIKFVRSLKSLFVNTLELPENLFGISLGEYLFLMDSVEKKKETGEYIYDFFKVLFKLDPYDVGELDHEEVYGITNSVISQLRQVTDALKSTRIEVTGEEQRAAESIPEVPYPIMMLCHVAKSFSLTIEQASEMKIGEVISFLQVESHDELYKRTLQKSYRKK